MSNAKQRNTTNPYLDQRSAHIDAQQVLAAADGGEPARAMVDAVVAVGVPRGYVAMCDHLCRAWLLQVVLNYARTDEAKTDETRAFIARQDARLKRFVRNLEMRIFATRPNGVCEAAALVRVIEFDEPEMLQDGYVDRCPGRTAQAVLYRWARALLVSFEQPLRV